MKRFLSVFTAVSALILAVGCTQPGANPPADTTAPADAERVTGFGGAAGSLKVGEELTDVAQQTLRGGEFTVSYTFAAGKWKSGLKAALYLGDTLIAEAKDNTTTKDNSTFSPLSADKNLLEGGNLVLKFRFGSGNPSDGKQLLLDKTPPTISKAERAGTALTLTLSEPLAKRDANTGPGGFTLAGTDKTVTDIAAVAANATTVVLTLGGDPGTASVTLTYTQPTETAKQIRDRADNALAGITNVSVGRSDGTPPPQPQSVTTITGGADGRTALSNQAGADKVLNKADEAALKAHPFRINYTFASGTPFKTGSVAVLYQETAKIAEATTTTTAAAAEFAALGETSLTSGQALTLKFRDAEGESEGIKAADVDTAAPAAPTALTVEDIDAAATPPDTTINLPDISGASGGDGAGIDLGFTAAAALESGDKVTVAGFGAANSTKEFTGAEIKPGTGTNAYKVTMAAADITDGSKSITVKVTDAAGNAGNASTAVTLTVEITAPTIANAALNAAALTLTMSEALASRGESTGTGGFTLGGATGITVASIAAVDADATTVVLTLSAAPAATASVTLTYVQPAAAAEQIRDKAGNALASIASAGAVTVKDATLPTIQSASRTGASITLRLSEPLAGRGLFTGDDGGFTLAVTGGTAVTVNRIEKVTADATTVVLTLSGDPGDNAEVTLTYTKPPNDQAKQIRDKAGNALADVSPAIPVPQDTTPPRIAKAAFDGTALTLTMNEALRARAATTGAGGFTLGRTGVTVNRIEKVTADATTVVLTLSGDPGASATVTLTYTQPTLEAVKIKDKAGNALASITDPVNVEQPDKTAPPEPNSVTTITGGAGGNTELSNQTGTDKVLNKADEAVLKAHSFRVNYTFATGTTFETGSKAVLYQGAAKVADATTTRDTWAEFAALATTASLRSGTALTLKFEDAAGNKSTGVKAADVDTEAPAAPTAVTIEDITAGTDTTINLADIDGTDGTDTEGIDVSFTLAPAVAAGDTVTVTGFGATATAAKTFTEITGNKVTMSKTDITDGSKSVTVKVTDAAGNEGGSSTAVTLNVEITAPTIKKVELVGTALTLTMSEALRARDASTGAGGFTLGGAIGITVASIAAVDPDAKTVVLTLSAAPAADATVSLTYTKPTAAAEQIRDKAGNALADIASDDPVIAKDNTPPTIKSASQTGTTLTVTMSEALAARDASNGNGGFSLHGTNYSVESIAKVIAGAKTVVLTLNADPFGIQGLKLSYQQPEEETDKIKDRAGNALASIAEDNAVDITQVAETVPPRITKAELEGYILTLTMSESLSVFDAITGDGGFTVTGTTTTFTVQRVEIPAGPSVKTVILTLDKTAQSGETVTLTYSQPSTETERIKDKVGNALASITTANAVSVTVKSVPADTTAPRIQSASRTGTTLTLTMSEALAARGASQGKSGFELTGTNVTVASIAAVAANATTVLLTLSATPAADATVSLTYNRPSDEAKQIRDKAGNALASIGSGNTVTVTLKAPADTTPPTIVRVKWAAGGLDLIMSEPLSARPELTGNGGFELQGTSVTVSEMSVVTAENRVTLALTGQPNTVALIYTRPPASSDWIRDVAGNALASFTTPIGITP